MTPPEPAIEPQAASVSKSIGMSQKSSSLLAAVRVLELEGFVAAQDFRRRSAGNDGLEFAAVLGPAAQVVDQLAHRDLADFDFVIAGPLHVAADADDARAGVVRRAELRVFGAAHADDVLHVAERLDVVDDGRAHVEAEHGREIRRLDARIGALAFERFDQAGFLAADVGARAAVDVDFQIVAGAENVLAEEILRARFLERLFEDLRRLAEIRRGCRCRRAARRSRSRR